MSNSPAPVVSPASTQCECWATTLRIYNLCSRGRGRGQSRGVPSSTSSPLSSPLSSTMSSTTTTKTTTRTPPSKIESQRPQSRAVASSLSDSLTISLNLVQHWETLNGCANSASHMESQILQYMAESMSWVLRDYETVVDAMFRDSSEAQTTENQSASMLNATPNLPSTLGDKERPTHETMPRAFFGKLELDLDEAIIVAQEALSHWIARLTVMLQDMEEEVALQRQQPKVDYPLQEKDTKDLVTRLFRLLRRVDGLGIGTQ